MGGLKGKFAILVIILTGVAIFQPNFYQDYENSYLRRIQIPAIERLRRLDPALADMITAEITEENIQNRIASIFLRAYNKWQIEENGVIRFDNTAAEIVIEIASEIGSNNFAKALLELIEELAESYNLNYSIRALTGVEPGRRKAILAELLHLKYLKEYGYTDWQGEQYEVSEIIATTVKIGDVEVDGLVKVIHLPTGKEKYILIQSKNKDSDRFNTGTLLAKIRREYLKVTAALQGRSEVEIGSLCIPSQEIRILFLISAFRENIADDIETSVNMVRRAIDPASFPKMEGIIYVDLSLINGYWLLDEIRSQELP